MLYPHWRGRPARAPAWAAAAAAAVALMLWIAAPLRPRRPASYPEHVLSIEGLLASPEVLRHVTVPVAGPGTQELDDAVPLRCERSAPPPPRPDGYAPGSEPGLDGFVHREVTVRRRAIIVGDPHGCAQELSDILQRARFDHAAGDVVIITGDLVGKGPNSSGTVALVRDTPGIYSVRGNHDEWAMGHPEEAAAEQGLTAAHLDFLRTLPFSITLQPSIRARVVHAGIVAGIALRHQALEALLMMRNVVVHNPGGGQPARLVPTQSPWCGAPWATVWHRSGRHVYFGHDARRGLQRFERATGLDTGCVYGGRLTAAILPGGELISVPARRAYARVTSEKRASAAAGAQAAVQSGIAGCANASALNRRRVPFSVHWPGGRSYVVR